MSKEIRIKIKGPAGVGKSTIALFIARALNCEGIHAEVEDPAVRQMGGQQHARMDGLKGGRTKVLITEKVTRR